MKPVPIVEPVVEAPRVPHPDADKPLTAFQSITAVCDDCGHVAVLDRERLLSMPAVPNFGWLWKHAYCAECRAAGAEKTHITMTGLLLDRNPEPVAWSEKEVFTDERDDLNPQLPRRRMFA